jgi:hypothetical protein
MLVLSTGWRIIMSVLASVHGVVEAERQSELADR